MTYLVDILPGIAFAQQNYLPAEAEATLNTLQLWFITGASIMLVFLVLWQIFQNNARNRKGSIVKNAKEEAERILAAAREQGATDAEAIRKEAELQAQTVVIAAKKEAENTFNERRKEFSRTEERLAFREETLEQKLGILQDRLAELDKRDAANKAEANGLEETRKELAAQKEKNFAELQRIAGLNAEDAKKELLDTMRLSMENERSQMIRRMQEESRQELVNAGREIMINAMQRYAGDCAFEHTTTTVPLPNEEMKGRIIGREGRNIRTLEAATGTNLLVNETPQAVVISCHDSIRREVARLVLEKLVADGRIHPTRVEEVVEKTRQELEQEIAKTGQEAADRLDVRLPQNLIQLLGTLKFRFSFSQNVLTHSIEVASMAGAMAVELGLDEMKARRAGLLHDIGKAVDHEVEGTHASIGAELLRRAGEDPVVVNAVAAHHEEQEKTSAIAVLVQICDTLSAARPGARAETTEFFLHRLEDLERIGNSFAGVESCFAVQAGRELRVMVKPEEISEDGAIVLAREMAERIESEMRYPGQIRVSVIRETRVIDYAK